MPSPADHGFPETHHSAVRGLRDDDSAVRERSLESVIRAYWKPAYFHVRVKWKLNAPDAEDAVQDFFDATFVQQTFAGYDPAVGRFRAFFKTCLDRVVSNRLRAERTLRRGGTSTVLAFDQAELELERAGAATWEAPEACFDREYRRQLFATAIGRLRERCESEGKQAAFEAFERYDLAVGARPTYDELGVQLGVPATTVTNHLAWARRTVRALVLEQLEALTATEQELRDEATDMGVG